MVLRQAEEEALEECLLVMKPCDPANPDDDDACLDEEVRFPFVFHNVLTHTHMYLHTRESDRERPSYVAICLCACVYAIWQALVACTEASEAAVRAEMQGQVFV